MTEKRTSSRDIPILRDRVTEEIEQLKLPVALPEDVAAELQTELAHRVFELTDDLLRAAIREVESTLFQRVSDELRAQLPELVAKTINELLDREQD